MKKLSEVKVGDAIELKHTLGKYDPIFYAGASGDFNFIHIDPEFGKMVGLGGNILQGLCTMAYTARCHTDWAGDPYALKRLRVRFNKPVYPENTVTVQSTIVAVENGCARTEFKAVNQKGDEVIINGAAEVKLSDG